MVKEEGRVELELDLMDILAVWGLEPNKQNLAKIPPPGKPPFFRRADFLHSTMSRDCVVKEIVGKWVGEEPYQGRENPSRKFSAFSSNLRSNRHFSLTETMVRRPFPESQTFNVSCAQNIVFTGGLEDVVKICGLRITRGSG